MWLYKDFWLMQRQGHKSQPFEQLVWVEGGSRKMMVLLEACWGAKVSMVSWQMRGQIREGIWAGNGDIGILHVTDTLGKEETHQRQWEEGMAEILPNSVCNNHCSNSSKRLCWFHDLKDGSSGGERICVVWGSSCQLVVRESERLATAGLGDVIEVVPNSPSVMSQDIFSYNKCLVDPRALGSNFFFLRFLFREWWSQFR